RLPRRRLVAGPKRLAHPEARARLRVGLAGRPLEQRGHALADADAQRREAVAAVAAAELVQERHDEARAAHSERMAERDRAAVDIDPLRVEAQLTDDREALRRERLVQLDEIDILDADTRPLEQLPHRGDR